MKGLLRLCMVVALVGLVQPVLAADITVMTQNQYLGGGPHAGVHRTLPSGVQ